MILWFGLALGLGMIGIVGWYLSRKGDFIAERRRAARGNVEQRRHVRPPLINTWIIFTHGH